MKISVIGAGNIGGTLGAKWAAAGHDLVFGVRDPEATKVRALLAEIEGQATAVAVAESLVDADVVLFAIPGRVMASTVAQLGPKLNGKILIDATNRVGEQPMHSLDALRQAAPESAIFRAFSNLGWENFAEPKIDGVQIDLFYCGDGGGAQTAVADLIAEIGLRPIYVGDAAQVDLIDALTRLWFTFAFQQKRGRHLALKLLES